MGLIQCEYSQLKKRTTNVPKEVEAQVMATLNERGFITSEEVNDLLITHFTQ